jgi:hypothetical protein
MLNSDTDIIHGSSPLYNPFFARSAAFFSFHRFITRFCSQKICWTLYIFRVRLVTISRNPQISPAGRAARTGGEAKGGLYDE